jgi:pimeloyl-ACP methyl ester carboxylesterase
MKVAQLDAPTDPIRPLHLIWYVAEWLGVWPINRTNQLCQILASTYPRIPTSAAWLAPSNLEVRNVMAELSKSAATIVLVHGGFVDGAGWEGVYNILKKDGYNVSIVQNPTTSLADDVAATRLAIARAQGPVVLVGHSYGGVVVTEAGTDPKVAGLVYITAFAPDKGESVESLIKNPSPGAPVPPILPPLDGYLFLDTAKFRASFAADVSEAKAAFLADSQVPWGVAALSGSVSEPAWKTKPSWYLVATDDKMIPPPAQRQMATRAGSTIAEAAGSHAIYISKPEAVAALIAKAAKSVSSRMAA